ncbi:MAG: transglycosylase domain-containing protein [Ignavibacteria bacterium]|nr:transglycosylase domain-containing protein [Ignavibacteria bacterium]
MESQITQFPALELTNYYSWYAAQKTSRKLSIILLSVLTFLYLGIPGIQVPLLEYSVTRHSSLMDQRIIESMGTMIPRQSVVDFDEISPLVMKCTISMEDDAFFQHKGVNWTELKKSMTQNQKKKKASRGGSTITMQLVKNLYFTTNRSVFRKAKEIIVTFRLEKELSKQAILEQYFNVIEWGNGIFGIAEASDTYFHKKPIDLTLNDAAKLAAVIPAPLHFKPTDSKKFVDRRSSIIKTRYGAVQMQK